jgi:hypothetical protein
MFRQFSIFCISLGNDRWLPKTDEQLAHAKKMEANVIPMFVKQIVTAVYIDGFYAMKELRKMHKLRFTLKAYDDWMAKHQEKEIPDKMANLKSFNLLDRVKTKLAKVIVRGFAFSYSCYRYYIL